LPQGEEIGPFDNITRKVLNEAFGYEVISIPCASDSGRFGGYLQSSPKLIAEGCAVSWSDTSKVGIHGCRPIAIIQ
jgi:hypothetical protein